MTTMTLDERETRQRNASGTTVRPAGLVDVPPVVRLLVGPPTPADVPPEQARRALRLVMAHYLLEEGMVWVAERGPGQPHGRPVAAAVWLPSEARPPEVKLNAVLLRETGHPIDFVADGERTRAVLASAWPGEPHWTLTTAGLFGDASWDESLATALLAPGLRVADQEAAAVVALAPTAADARRLRPFGFAGVREIRLPGTAPGHAAWLTTRRPRGLTSGNLASHGGRHAHR